MANPSAFNTPASATMHDLKAYLAENLGDKYVTQHDVLLENEIKKTSLENYFRALLKEVRNQDSENLRIARNCLNTIIKNELDIETESRLKTIAKIALNIEYSLLHGSEIRPYPALGFDPNNVFNLSPNNPGSNNGDGLIYALEAFWLGHDIGPDSPQVAASSNLKEKKKTSEITLEPSNSINNKFLEKKENLPEINDNEPNNTDEPDTPKETDSTKQNKKINDNKDESQTLSEENIKIESDIIEFMRINGYTDISKLNGQQFEYIKSVYTKNNKGRIDQKKLNDLGDSKSADFPNFGYLANDLWKASLKNPFISSVLLGATALAIAPASVAMIPAAASLIAMGRFGVKWGNDPAARLFKKASGFLRSRPTSTTEAVGHQAERKTPSSPQEAQAEPKPAAPPHAAQAEVKPAAPPQAAQAEVNTVAPPQAAQAEVKPVAPPQAAQAEVKPVAPPQAAQAETKPAAPPQAAQAETKPAVPPQAAQAEAKPAVEPEEDQTRVTLAAKVKTNKNEVLPAVPSQAGVSTSNALGNSIANLAKSMKDGKKQTAEEVNMVNATEEIISRIPSKQNSPLIPKEKLVTNNTDWVYGNSVSIIEIPSKQFNEDGRISRWLDNYRNEASQLNQYLNRNEKTKEERDEKLYIAKMHRRNRTQFQDAYELYVNAINLNAESFKDKISIKNMEKIINDYGEITKVLEVFRFDENDPAASLFDGIIRNPKIMLERIAGLLSNLSHMMSEQSANLNQEIKNVPQQTASRSFRL